MNNFYMYFHNTSQATGQAISVMLHWQFYYLLVTAKSMDSLLLSFILQSVAVAMYHGNV